MSAITTHVLDTARGRPAAGVPVALAILGDDGRWTELAAAPTDQGGRVGNLLPENVTDPKGTYRLRFEVGKYFDAQKREAFYPYVEIVFTVRQPGEHHHVPLLLSPYGYTTYRGS